MNYLALITMIVPEDYRDSCMGDLFELDAVRRESKQKNFLSTIILFLQSLLVLYAGIRMRLDDINDCLRVFITNPAFTKAYHRFNQKLKTSLCFFGGAGIAILLGNIGLSNVETLGVTLMIPLATITIINFAYSLQSNQFARHSNKASHSLMSHKHRLK